MSSLVCDFLYDFDFDFDFGDGDVNVNVNGNGNPLELERPDKVLRSSLKQVTQRPAVRKPKTVNVKPFAMTRRASATAGVTRERGRRRRRR